MCTKIETVCLKSRHDFYKVKTKVWLSYETNKWPDNLTSTDFDGDNDCDDDDCFLNTCHFAHSFSV